MIINGDRVRICKEVALTCFKVVSEHLPGETGKPQKSSVRITDNPAKI
jgi:hypothetical protein